MTAMLTKWLKLKRKSKQEPQAELKAERLRRPITSMMGPEPGAIIGGKRRRR
jgi:hypothetical protein